MATEAGPSTANEPNPASPTRIQDKHIEDADTCRICRGEGTPTEPLFYPCKCSGSIKFVHQDCLMEWLSHSQKKYCELCKTSFRFTKLYHPGMPNRIPTSVFVRRAAIHVVKMWVTWLRAVLVASVWLVLLPYCMRVVWRSLFWVGDGGWSRELYVEPDDSDTSATPLQPWDLETVRSAIESAKAANTSVSLPLPSLLMPFSQTLNMTAGEPTVWSLIKRFFFGLTYPLSDLSPLSGPNNTTSNATIEAFGARNPSLLSDISFFKWFPSQAANRFLIDVLEGQLITLLVVVAFILIFLIREWVVQQQPVINMVALGQDGGAERDAQPADEDVDSEDENDEDKNDEGEPVYDNGADGAPEFNINNHEGELANHPRLRRRRQSANLKKRRAILTMLQESEDIPEQLRRAIEDGSPEEVAKIIDDMPLADSAKLQEQLQQYFDRVDEEHADASESGLDSSNKGSEIEEDELEASASNSQSYPERSSSLPHNAEQLHEDGSHESTNLRHRPNMPARDRSFIATEIRRNMEEGETWSFADVPPTSKETSHHTRGNVPESWEDEEAMDDSRHQEKHTQTPDQRPESEHSSESWQQVPDIVVNEGTDRMDSAERSRDKGKARVSGDDHPEIPAQATTPIEEETLMYDPVTTDDYNGTATDEDHPVLDLTFGEVDNDESGARADPDREPLRQVAHPPRGFMDRILDWMFGDVAPGMQAVEDDANDEHVVQDLADEAPFVHFDANEFMEQAVPPIQDPEVAAAAAQAGIDLNDQDAIDDAEDLEGIMELIGMQGPLTGLFQNAMFSAVLISATLACAVWFPYLWGKVVLLFVGSPVSLFIKLPLRLIAALADFVVDTALFAGAGAIFWGAQFLKFALQVISAGKLSRFIDRPMSIVAEPARSIAEGAAFRIGDLMLYSSLLPHPDYFRLSVNSHAALRNIQNSTSFVLNQTGDAIGGLFENATAAPPSEVALGILRQLPIMIQDAIMSAYEHIGTLLTWVWSAKSYKITLDWDLHHNITSTHTTTDQWTATDRMIAIFAGYAFFAVAGALYLKRGSPISTSQQGRKIEGIVSDILQQAGGVLKVILIISIEMLAFPLYCGLLLDVALLPLFQNATIYTRWRFARESPWTSGFVHWFIGTCYMFHFALFVSMCRKIMRKGVLYFIRDPDDPTFHPVRDVLERSVTTQLRKIAFSALVYGALVIVCLGGVVWGLNRATTGVLPIRWTSQAPSLEFPLDLLFYNFLTPFVIRIYKPSDGFHAVYRWWFRACARSLRLSNFLFGEKAKEEEGHHVRLTWASWFAGEKGDPANPLEMHDTRIKFISDGKLELKERADVHGPRAYFVFDGKYVRAPGSDQVRIPKGGKVFVEVDKDNCRLDGKSDEEGVVHNNFDLVTMVYIPPWFRVRIALFIATIWLFAATTGIGMTVVPLLFGRYLFSLFLPPTVEMNDIHAFSLGIYSLGTIAYSMYHLYKYASTLGRPIPSSLSTVFRVAATTTKFGLRVVRFTYVWSSLVFVIPFLFAMLLELYFLMPLHAYLGPREPHVVHVIQDWTLGFLYARLAARVVFSNRTSRAARAFSAVVADGYLNPNARLATRCFLLPVVMIFAVAVTIPSAAAWTLNRTVWLGSSAECKSQVWRFSFPLIGLFLLGTWVGKEGAIMLMRWRMIVRDEVYLIGERLHNFGERKPPQAPESSAVSV